MGADGPPEKVGQEKNLLPMIQLQKLFKWQHAKEKKENFDFNAQRGASLVLLMVSALDSGASVPGSSPGRGHLPVVLGKTLHSHGASLHPGV